MGMAAGQARLLSITTRLSDNELRAQIINNDKMRLATKSSQVSENYVKALNEAQMMFTNYDSENNTSFQQLTFNALTAFNPYNNQYSLSNSSGKILVSERDAGYFSSADGDLEKFLKSYGLEQTTTYFKSLPTVGGQVQYPTVGVDEDGNVIFANAGTGEELQKLYEGKENNPPSYTQIVGSEYYYQYTDKLDIYQKKQDELYATIGGNMLETLNSQKLNVAGNNTTFGELRTIVGDNPKEACKTLEGFINNMLSGDLSKYFVNDITNQNYMNDILERAQNGAKGMTTDKLTSENLEYKDGYVIFDGTLAIRGGLIPSVVLCDEDGNPDATKPINVNTKVEDGKYTLEFYIKEKGENEYEYSTSASDGAEYVKITGIPVTETADADITYVSSASDDEISSVASSIIRSLQSAIYNIWDPTNEDFIDKDSQEYKDYIEAAKELANTLGITGLSTLEDYNKLGDILTNNFTFTNNDKKTEFNNIRNSIILDNVMNTYGEPKYAWIDTSEPTDSYNENGEAKAQWYTNLFERMSKTGYMVLKDGLASSTEWIKFALESGVVTMEQVDESNKWNTIMYSNCSDITEQTDAAAVAKAEAEYNAAMNKIENKDKMYDLELKNIDTEHNSLQTEYDSIKSAIDKNIERTFKLYG